MLWKRKHLPGAICVLSAIKVEGVEDIVPAKDTFRLRVLEENSACLKELKGFTGGRNLPEGATSMGAGCLDILDKPTEYLQGIASRRWRADGGAEQHHGYQKHQHQGCGNTPHPPGGLGLPAPMSGMKLDRIWRM